MTVSDFLRTLWKNWVLIVVLGIAGAAVGYGVSATNPSQFRSSSSVLVTTGLGSTAQELVQGSTYIEKLVASYAELAGSELVLEPVIEELGLDTTVRQLSGRVSATAELNTVIINVSAVAGSPEEAQAVAASVTRHLATTVAELSPQDASQEPTVRLTTIESASLPQQRFEPNTRLWAIIGGALGGFSGVVIALLRRFVADVVSSPADVASTTDVPVLGEIPEARRGRSTTETILNDPRSIEAEAYAALSANLSFVGVDEGIRSVVVASGSSAEGKSTSATGLAIALADPSKRVLLIDADLRSPSIDKVTGLDGSLGLTSALVGSASLADVAQPWGVDGLHVVTSGPQAPNPAQLLRSEAMRSLLRDATDHYDLVVVDSAPLLSVTDAVWLGHMTDGLLLVVQRRRTRVRSLTRTLLTLSDAKVPVAGIVLNRVARKTRSTYGDVRPSD